MQMPFGVPHPREVWQDANQLQREQAMPPMRWMTRGRVFTVTNIQSPRKRSKRKGLAFQVLFLHTNTTTLRCRLNIHTLVYSLLTGEYQPKHGCQVCILKWWCWYGGEPRTGKQGFVFLTSWRRLYISHHVDSVRCPLSQRRYGFFSQQLVGIS